jgi:hypothetical protein
LDSPSRYAISTQTATPMSPDTAGCMDSRRISRHSKISVATPRAAPAAAARPISREVPTKTSTGTDE